MAPNVYRFRSSTDLMERDFRGKFSSVERFRNEKLKAEKLQAEKLQKKQNCNKVHFENEDENEDDTIPDLKTWISRLK